MHESQCWQKLQAHVWGQQGYMKWHQRGNHFTHKGIEKKYYKAQPRCDNTHCGATRNHETRQSTEGLHKQSIIVHLPCHRDCVERLYTSTISSSLRQRECTKKSLMVAGAPSQREL